MKEVLFALYIACSIVPVIFVVVVIVRMIIRGRGESVLCMECGACNTSCPLMKKKGENFPGPAEIMASAKAGDGRGMIDAGALRCPECGLCEKACPRGLSAGREVGRLKAESGLKGNISKRKGSA